MSPRLYKASAEALFRYQVVSAVQAHRLLGYPLGEAVRVAAKKPYHCSAKGQLRGVSVRTLYRWVAAFDKGGLEELEPAARRRTSTSDALSEKLLSFLRAAKELDKQASIPELIARARELGELGPDEPVCRVSVWRALKRMGVDVQRRKGAGDRDTHRFSYPHRMQMMLCDGKHFRAGVKRLKRVVLFFLDDCSRLGLHAVVGPSESGPLFLRGLYETVRRHGLMDIVYLDRGPGFRGLDTASAVSKLGALLILGEAGYPSGHGKIEKFIQFSLHRVLRNLDRRPDVDPDCGALELRLQHFLHEVYNRRPHASLDQLTPWQCWDADERELRFTESDAELRRCFVVHEKRRVSNDNVVSVDSVGYEVPRGHSGSYVQLQRHLLDGDIAMEHNGQLVTLQPVDLAANAIAPRARKAEATDDEPAHPLPPTAAELRFSRAFAPVVSADGGCPEPIKPTNSKKEC
jgi:transposase InsO family protein